MNLALPTELWVQIAMTDPRIYNALARTNTQINNALDPDLARASFLSTVNIEYLFHGVACLIELPTLCGAVHTPFYIDTDTSSVVDYYVAVAASYGKLIAAEDNASFEYIGQHMKLWIYANDGVVSRNAGPAVVVMTYGIHTTIKFIEIYTENGMATKIFVGVLADLYPDGVGASTAVVELNLRERNATRHSISVSMAAMITAIRAGMSAEKYMHDNKVTIGSSPRSIWFHMTDRRISEINAHLAELGTNIPAISDTISRLTNRMCKLLSYVNGGV